MGWQAEENGHQHAQLSTVRDDENVAGAVGRVTLVEPFHEPTRPVAELTDVLASGRRRAFSVKLATRPGLAKPVRVEQRGSVTVASALEDAVVHLTQIRVKGDIAPATGDDLRRSRGSLEIAGVDRVEVNVREPGSDGSRLLLSALIEDDVEVALEDTVGIGARLSVPDQPERRRHALLPFPHRGAALGRPSESPPQSSYLTVISTLWIVTGSFGLDISPFRLMPTGTLAIASTTSMPWVTVPKIEYFFGSRPPVRSA